MTSSFTPISAETVRAARSVFHPSNHYLQVGDRINMLLEGVDFEPLSRSLGSSFEFTAILALITAFQYEEQLTDRQAADATRVRIDWKYALHLPAFFPGLRPYFLCDFRLYSFQLPASLDWLALILNRMSALGFFANQLLLPPGQVLEAVCMFNRVERVTSAMKNVLSKLASTDPDWLRTNIRSAWFLRYLDFPTDQPEQSSKPDPSQSGLETGKDIQFLLKVIRDTGVEPVKTETDLIGLSRILEDQFEIATREDLTCHLQWRKGGCIFSGSSSAPVTIPKRRCYQV